jgi:hypothetical protein
MVVNVGVELPAWERRDFAGGLPAPAFSKIDTRQIGHTLLGGQRLLSTCFSRRSRGLAGVPDCHFIISNVIYVQLRIIEIM